jgi:hypothetical protein
MYNIKREQMEKDALHHHQATVPNDCAEHSVPAGIAIYKPPTSVISLVPLLTGMSLCTHTQDFEVDIASEGVAAAHDTETPAEVLVFDVVPVPEGGAATAAGGDGEARGQAASMDREADGYGVRCWGRVVLVRSTGVGLIRCEHPPGLAFAEHLDLHSVSTFRVAEHLDFSQEDAGGTYLMSTDEVSFVALPAQKGNRRRAILIECPRRIGRVIAWHGTWGFISMQVAWNQLQEVWFHESDAPFAAFFAVGDKVTFEESRDATRATARKVLGGRSMLFKDMKAKFADGMVAHEKETLSSFISLHNGTVVQAADETANCVIGGVETEEMIQQLSSEQVYREIHKHCTVYKTIGVAKRRLPSYWNRAFTPHVGFRLKIKEPLAGTAAEIRDGAGGTGISSLESRCPKFVRLTQKRKTQSKSKAVSEPQGKFPA